MSFKREGDDASQLNVLKKRRVAELLSHFIPEDEAALLKNGGYTCLVCSYRPVFDTVDMLTVHRAGKRHLEGLKWFYGKKRGFENEVAKRRHQAYVKAEEEGRQEVPGPAPLLVRTRRITHHALLKSAPYNSCHQKKSRFSGDRPTDDCGPTARNHKPQPVTEGTSGVDAASVTSLPGHSVSQSDQNSRKGKGKKKKSRPAGPAEPDPGAVERRRELEHYLKLKSSGWIQDRGGEWVKDENVEFDSDEETPLPAS